MDREAHVGYRRQAREELERGETVAALLARSWLEAPAGELTVSPEALADAAPAIIRHGSEGLAWWRIRGTALAASPAGERLRLASHRYRLRTLAQENLVDRIVVALYAL